MDEAPHTSSESRTDGATRYKPCAVAFLTGAWLVAGSVPAQLEPAICHAQAASTLSGSAAAPVLAPPPLPPAPVPAEEPQSDPTRPSLSWKFVGLSIQQTRPSLESLLLLPGGELAVGFEAQSGTQTDTVVYRIGDGSVSRVLRDAAPLALLDGRQQLCAITMRGDQPQLVVRQETSSGTRSLRLMPIPLPSSASAAFPYLLWPAQFAPDGALIMLGSGRDRLYRINLALGESRAILPDQPLDIVDFDISPSGELLVLDAFEQRLVWLNLDGTLLESQPLTRTQTPEPSHYYLSVAAGPERAAWVGAAVRQPDGQFTPEIQRIQARLKQRQPLGNADAPLNMPLELSSDGLAGVFAFDEGNRLLQLSSAVQPLRTWEVKPGGAQGSSAETTFKLTRRYLADSGMPLPGLDAVMSEAMPQLQRCYENLLLVTPRVGGRYRLHVTTRDRSIQRVEVTEKGFSDLGLESCVGRALTSPRFPTRVGQQAFRLELTFSPPAGRKP